MMSDFWRRVGENPRFSPDGAWVFTHPTPYSTAPYFTAPDAIPLMMYFSSTMPITISGR
ncbi:MAG: hypothetical protein ACI9BH_003436, partial [Paracoccaceae bacterium]